MSCLRSSGRRPSFPGEFATLFELTRYIRALATLVTPDPNAMLRVARLCDAKWHMPDSGHEAEGKPRAMALGDAMQIASALWVKEAIGVPDLEFLTFDGWCSPEGTPTERLCLLYLQDYAVDTGRDADVKAAIRLTRLEPLVHARSSPIPCQRDKPAALWAGVSSFRARESSASIAGARMVLTANRDPSRL